MLRCLLISAACLACAHAIPAQDASSRPPPPATQAAAKPPETFGRITGTVFCSDTLKPARGAQVSINTTQAAQGDMRQYQSTHSDAEGHFTFRVKSGQYIIQARMIGYVLDDDPIQTTSSSAKDAQRADETHATDKKSPYIAQIVNVHPAEIVTHNVTMERGAALNGAVFYDDGSPLVGGTLRIEEGNALPNPDEVKRGGSPVVETEVATNGYGPLFTDDRGAFRVAGLRPGNYRISVLPPIQSEDWITAVRDPDYGMSRTLGLAVYAGDTIHRANAKKFEVRAGDEVTGIQIIVPTTRLRRVGGMLVTADGEVLNIGIATLVDPSDPAILFVSAVKPDGSFLFSGVPPGAYQLMIHHAFLGKIDTNNTIIDAHPSLIPIAHFADLTEPLIVKDDDVTDLHFEMRSAEMPPRPPADDSN